MAKIIKCPNCGDNVEIPPDVTGSGQIVTCGGCGTALRLRGRRQGAGGGGAGGGGGGASSGAMSESMTATTITSSDPSDPPSFGTECAVCGTAVGDLSELTEDRGRLVCAACLKRPKKTGKDGGGAAGFAPEPMLDDTVHHGKMITVDATFLAAALMAAVVIGSQAWLHFHPRPVGTKVIAAPAPPKVATWEEQNAAKIRELARAAETAKNKADHKQTIEKADELLRLVGNNQLKDPSLIRLVSMVGGWRDAAAGFLGVPAAAPGRLSPGEMPAAPPPESAEPTTPRPLLPTTGPAASVADDAVAMKPIDPAARPDGIFGDRDPSVAQAEKALDAGYAALAAGEWRNALNAMIDLVPEDGREPNPQQLAAIKGVAAAYLGLSAHEDAAKYAARARRHDPTDRSAILNLAMTELATAQDRSLPRILDDLKAHLERTSTPDELAYDVFGTAIARTETREKVNHTALRPYQTALDAYTPRVNATRSGERKWGAEWQPARVVELQEKNIELMMKDIQRLEREEDTLHDRLVRAQLQVRRLTPNTKPEVAATVKGAEEDAANAFEKKRTELTEAKAALPKKTWLTTFKPAIPDRAAAATPAVR